MSDREGQRSLTIVHTVEGGQFRAQLHDAGLRLGQKVFREVGDPPARVQRIAHARHGLEEDAAGSTRTRVIMMDIDKALWPELRKALQQGVS